MAVDSETLRAASPTRRRASVRIPRWPAAAWASVGFAALFVAGACWWLSKDGSVPIDDAALHLGSAFNTYEDLSAGHLLKALTGSAPYPPFTFLIGALGVFVGGVGVAPPIVAQNLFFALLLALGCYKVARLAWNPLAGLLAVVFALGSPMVIEGFHQFMLDAPEAAMVAVAVWAVLATERFSRLGVSALAGVAVGLGMLSKETFAFFIAGVVLASAIRGGRRAWRGAAVFAAVALLIALPWYLYELSTIHALGSEALGSSLQVSGSIPGIAPPRLSLENLEWYFWSFLNWQLFLPLFLFFAVGWIWTLAGSARRRPVSGLAPELVLGAFVSWLAITETYVHDPRYSIPLVVYFAVFAAGWISRLPRVARAVAATALVLVALGNSLDVGFGVGGHLTSGPQSPTYIQQPGNVTLAANYGFWLGPPARDGDLLGLLRALRHAGVRELSWHSTQEAGTEFSPAGVAVLARIAGLTSAQSNSAEPALASRRDAFLLHSPPSANLPRPCIELRDGTGVWVRLGGAPGAKARSYCPRRLG
jgi:Dolichyl-phosphate-mannose-protein mannosyltransferase